MEQCTPSCLRHGWSSVLRPVCDTDGAVYSVLFEAGLEQCTPSCLRQGWSSVLRPVCGRDGAVYALRPTETSGL